MKISTKLTNALRCLLYTLALFFVLNLTANAATFQLGNPTFQYDGVYVGPYGGTLTADGGVTYDTTGYFFCLDEKATNYFGQSYSGNVTTLDSNSPANVQEAALLASYMLAVKDKTPDTTAAEFRNFEGAISFAVWEIMGNIGSGFSTDPAAQLYIDWAKSMKAANLIPTELLARTYLFTPTGSDAGTQRFIGAVRDNSFFDSKAPEPGTLAMLGAGLLLVGMGAARRRKTGKGAK
jgi:hypothetical protein